MKSQLNILTISHVLYWVFYVIIYILMAERSSYERPTDEVYVY